MRAIRIALALGLLACGGGTKKTDTGPTPPVADDHAAAPKTVAEAVDGGFQMLSSASDSIAGSTDCPGRGAALQSWGDTNKTWIEHIATGLRAFPGDQVQAEEQRRMPNEAKANALFQAANECKDDATFTAAWKSVNDAIDAAP